MPNTLTIDEINAKIEIGFKFYAQGKRKDIETIEDILTTTNSKGEIMQVEYVVSHQFMGQTVRHNVFKNAIQRSVWTSGLVDSNCSKTHSKS